ncbi:protein of unknown function [Brochothrix thermosphacta]|nr:protein of unknown function [Brochothrix thermosphacta]SPN76269.1 hypothetical protein BTEBP_60059 [Brochothrix thermosphacta]
MYKKVIIVCYTYSSNLLAIYP